MHVHMCTIGITVRSSKMKQYRYIPGIVKNIDSTMLWSPPDRIMLLYRNVTAGSLQSTTHSPSSIVIRYSQSIDLTMLAILGRNIVHTKTQVPIFSYQC